MTVSPAETAVICADLATKAAAVDLSFVDRFSGTLLFSGRVADVEKMCIRDRFIQYLRIGKNIQ